VGAVGACVDWLVGDGTRVDETPVGVAAGVPGRPVAGAVGETCTDGVGEGFVTRVGTGVMLGMTGVGCGVGPPAKAKRLPSTMLTAMTAPRTKLRIFARDHFLDLLFWRRDFFGTLSSRGAAAGTHTPSLRKERACA
jgi:hypothetical protein